MVNVFKSKYEKKIVEKLAEKYNVKVLRLPPYHCELNPIEMVWSQVKRYVASKNSSFKSEDVRKLIHDAYLDVTAENWANYVSHVQKVENSMWEIDRIMDDIEPIIFNVNNDSDSYSSGGETD